MCKQEDLRVEVVASAYVDKDGKPTEIYGEGDPNYPNDPYFCAGCDGDFKDWDEAIAHLDGLEVAA